MAIRGANWNPDKTKIIEAIKAHKGRITFACKTLGVCYETLRKYVEADPELTKALEDARNYGHNAFLDLAENTVEYALLNKEKDPGTALKAAIFTLNSKGNARGWQNTHKAEQTVIFKEHDPTERNPDSV